jgi:hypothetical protein
MFSFANFFGVEMNGLFYRKASRIPDIGFWQLNSKDFGCFRLALNWFYKLFFLRLRTVGLTKHGFWFFFIELGYFI